MPTKKELEKELRALRRNHSKLLKDLNDYKNQEDGIKEALEKNGLYIAKLEQKIEKYESALTEHEERVAHMEEQLDKKVADYNSVWRSKQDAVDECRELRRKVTTMAQQTEEALRDTHVVDDERRQLIEANTELLRRLAKAGSVQTGRFQCEEPNEAAQPQTRNARDASEHPTRDMLDVAFDDRLSRLEKVVSRLKGVPRHDTYNVYAIDMGIKFGASSVQVHSAIRAFESALAKTFPAMSSQHILEVKENLPYELLGVGVPRSKAEEFLEHLRSLAPFATFKIQKDE